VVENCAVLLNADYLQAVIGGIRSMKDCRMTQTGNGEHPDVASRTRDITSFIVMDVLEKACEMERQGVDVVHLEVGEPDFDTPACVKEAVCKAITDGHTHYTHSLGAVELREAICAYHHDTYGVSVDPDCVVVTSGTSPAIFMTFAVLLEAGEEVIISDPHYACYPNFIKFVGGVPVTVTVFEEDGFQFRPEAIAEAITAKTKAVFINSPSNPTGNLLSAARMAAIADMRPWVVSDEIYHGLVYEGKERGILEFTDEAFVLNGFSKLFAMTGLRLGYLIAPRAFMRPIQKIHQNFFISANAVVQKAGVAALQQAGEDTARMRTIYNERRQYMIQRLRAMGLGITVEPTGAFYVFANARHLSEDSYKLAFDILEKARVGVTPGIDFGKNGEGYLRFSYANSLENIAEGMDRLETYIQNRDET
jgi:aspartate/methionine/tyrosine aminotransferase